MGDHLTPKWTFDPTIPAGYVDLTPEDPDNFAFTSEVYFANATVLLDRDEEGNLRGIEVIL